MLDFEFSETSQNFCSFRQLLFIVSKGKGKLLKSCLKELKFCEVSENPKSSICWKFQLSISLGSKKSPSTIQYGRWSWTSPFDPFLLHYKCWLVFVKKNQNGRLKKTEIFKIVNSQKIFSKISQIGPWVSRIDWC